jgi:hypothetical protein
VPKNTIAVAVVVVLICVLAGLFVLAMSSYVWAEAMQPGDAPIRQIATAWRKRFMLPPSEILKVDLTGSVRQDETVSRDFKKR